MGTPTYTLSCRFECQFTGDNVNVWGVHLNVTLGRVDFAIAGWTTVALTGSRALTVSQAGDDEARSAALRFTGAGPYQVTLPSVSKGYYAKNDCSQAVTLTTGGGAQVQIDPGDVVQVFCDGTNVTTLGYGGLSLKDWISALNWSYNAGSLPAMPGNAGKFVKTDGTSGFWATVLTSDIGDWALRQAETRQYAMSTAIAMALVF